jgi:2,3-bisphosphoglycerate-independent phosphoglycerate mutase
MKYNCNIKTLNNPKKDLKMAKCDQIPPTMLVILDGFGYTANTTGNSIAKANMPEWTKILENHPNTLLHASGKYVGLPDGYIGNSEVGHTCIGAGRIIKTNFETLNELIKDESFFLNEKLLKLFATLKQNNKPLHLIGLLSDAGVHSHIKHFFAFIKLAKQVGVPNVYIHAILDGRDTEEKSAETYLKKLEVFCSEQQFGKIVTLHGRFYAMDRDKNWERTEKCYNSLCGNNAKPQLWLEVLDSSYKNNVTDEFIEPTILDQECTIQDGDGIVFLNFRTDRTRQITRSFIDPDFSEFKTLKKKLAFFFTITRYDESFKKFDNEVLFEQAVIKNTLLDEISSQATNKKVFIIAETEKYAHVTYFFKGKRDTQLPHETRVLIPSIKAKTYIDHPKMSSGEITNKLIESLQTNPAYFYLVNYANADMVGHSGNLEATAKACEDLDMQIKKLYEEVVVKQNGTIFFTADHGNAEEMEGKHKTSHTINPVPFVICNQKNKNTKTTQSIQKEYGIANIAPTILEHLQLKAPKEMLELIPL